jgi:hypothetical protein
VDDNAELRLFASGVAERALLQERAAGREPDPRSWRAVQAARQFAYGEIDSEALALAWHHAYEASVKAEVAAYIADAYGDRDAKGYAAAAEAAEAAVYAAAYGSYENGAAYSAAYAADAAGRAAAYRAL